MASGAESETAWLAGTEARTMLALLQGKARERKFRLFVCACCRRIDHLLSDDRSRRAIEVIEQYHDGKVTQQAYDLGGRRAHEAYSALSRDVAAEESTAGHVRSSSVRRIARMFAAQAVADCFQSTYWEVAQSCCGALRGDGTAEVEESQSRATGESIEAAERVAQVAILRDVFGNPFRPVTVDPSWLTSTVVALARHAYDSRDFSPMPILADALQDAGCENENVLDHCRQPGEHVRGCFVLDLLLGKS